MEKEIQRHQEVQKLQWELQDIFINAYDKRYDVQKTIDIIKILFDMREEEFLDEQFRMKYGTIQAKQQETKQG